MSDDLLIARLNEGDRAAFDQIYARHADRIHGFLLRLTRDEAAADDLAQDTWMAFARAAGALRPGSDIAAFLFTIARNQARSHRRWSLLDLLRLSLPESGCGVLDDAPGLDLRLDAARAARGLEQALAAIEVHHREALLLVHSEGFEQAQAADILGLSAAAFRKRLSRARDALAAELSRQGVSWAAARGVAR